MKHIGVISTTVFFLTLGLTASAYAQEQHDQKEEEKAKPAQQDEKKASPHKPSKAEKKAAEKQKDNAGQDEKATQQQNKDAKPEETSARQQPQHTEQAQPQEHAKGGDQGGGRIPEDRFRAHFGQEHKFHVSQADYGRDRRFQYGGYTFGFVDEWPSNWLYTQDVFVIEINGVYYLCNPTYPGVNITLNIAL